MVIKTERENYAFSAAVPFQSQHHLSRFYQQSSTPTSCCTKSLPLWTGKMKNHINCKTLNLNKRIRTVQIPAKATDATKFLPLALQRWNDNNFRIRIVTWISTKIEWFVASETSPFLNEFHKYLSTTSQVIGDICWILIMVKIPISGYRFGRLPKYNGDFLVQRLSLVKFSQRSDRKVANRQTNGG